jgi:hypothetical protein
VIIYEVYDLEDRSHNRHLFYTDAGLALKRLRSVCREWPEATLRVWDADYVGQQYLCLFTNGGAIDLLASDLKKAITKAKRQRKANEK